MHFEAESWFESNFLTEKMDGKSLFFFSFFFFVLLRNWGGGGGGGGDEKAQLFFSFYTPKIKNYNGYKDNPLYISSSKWENRYNKVHFFIFLFISDTPPSLWVKKK